MTIRETKERLLAALDVLNTLSEAIGENRTVLNVDLRGYNNVRDWGIFLDDETFQAVEEAFPQCQVAIVPMGDDFPGVRYRIVEISCVTVYTLMVDDAPEA